MKSAAVLMSTYNGEKYLPEQIESILAQKDVEVKLFVRDDGSSDGTTAILGSYAAEGRIEFTRGENLGVGNAFMTMLYSAPDGFDFYAFADQDDVWLPEKLSEGIAYLEKTGAGLYGCNQTLTDGEGKVICEVRYNENNPIDYSPEGILAYDPVAGSTMILTARFRALVCDEARRPSPELLKNRIHDVWLAEIASLMGQLVYDTRPFILYRQHGGNVAGAGVNKPSFMKVLKIRLKKLRDKNLRCGRSRLAAEALLRFPEWAAGNEWVTMCADVKGCKAKRRLLKHGKSLRALSGEGRFTFFVKVIMGWF